MSLALLLSVAGIILWGFAFLYLRSYIKRRTGQERILSDFRDEVDKMIADIDAATDRDITLVEERVKALRKLLEDADKRIAVYKTELERRNSQESAYAELGRRYIVKNDAPPVKTGHAGAFADVSEPADNGAGAQSELGFGAGTAAPGTEAAPDGIAPGPAAAGGSPETPAGPGLKPRFIRSSVQIEPKPPSFAERVNELARAGFSSDLIANRLGATVAEVDLVIALSGNAAGLQDE
ncbi:hypothetical protein [Breznakiella homolactica]|uniref:DUF2802 domain-containing protein n=1 Tax=Breznakiella homolactica TaxID=2798577 RepID=A0A7T7XKV4_9SPIR|nr:hypothetical protein [Breznakiella homolactica]QQO08236.1 hypothetical protein JFL75_15030 [Breznakiella homolactica]